MTLPIVKGGTVKKHLQAVIEAGRRVEWMRAAAFVVVVVLLSRFVLGKTLTLIMFVALPVVVLLVTPAVVESVGGLLLGLHLRNDRLLRWPNRQLRNLFRTRSRT